MLSVKKEGDSKGYINLEGHPISGDSQPSKCEWID